MVLNAPGEHRSKTLVVILVITCLQREKGGETQHAVCIFTRMHESYSQTITSIIWEFLFKLLQGIHMEVCVIGIIKEKSVIRENVFHMVWNLITMMDFRYQLG